MRTKTKLEYIWLDGYEIQNIRSKIKVIDGVSELTINDIPSWSFDGSSTKQATGADSDCVLKPIRLYKNHNRRNYYIVLCEVFGSDGHPHSSNVRAQLRNYDSLNRDKYWFAFEQEFFMYSEGKPLGWTDNMAEQGEYYCGVGSKNVAGRSLSNRHLDKCIDSGINITGTNAEVAKGQWEFQVFAKDGLHACDDLVVANYLLMKEAEKWNIDIEYHPKPIQGDWNGSGCHINFSTEKMREIGGEELFTKVCKLLGQKHQEHMESYGKFNDERLTGSHETQHIDKFSYGVSDRGASIRIPVHTVENGWKGYLEDRRPSSNLNPYLATMKIVDTLWSAFKDSDGNGGM